MKKTNLSPSIKSDAFRQLGITSKKRQLALAHRFDCLEVDSGRQILRAGSLMSTVVVGVSGSVLVSDARGFVTQLEAPFVFDSWAASDQCVADYSAVTETKTAVLLLEWRYRHLVFEQARQLHSCSAHSELAIQSALEKFYDTNVAELKPTTHIHYV